MNWPHPTCAPTHTLLYSYTDHYKNTSIQYPPCQSPTADLLCCFMCKPALDVIAMGLHFLPSPPWHTHMSHSKCLAPRRDMINHPQGDNYQRISCPPASLNPPDCLFSYGKWVELNLSSCTTLLLFKSCCLNEGNCFNKVEKWNLLWNKKKNSREQKKWSTHESWVYCWQGHITSMLL